MGNASIRQGATCLQASRDPSSFCPHPTPFCGVCCPASLPFAFQELLTPQSWWGGLSHLPLEPQKGAQGRDSARRFPPGGTGTQELSAGCEDGRGRASLLKPPGLLVQVGEAERRSIELPLGQNQASLQGPLVGEGRHCSGVCRRSLKIRSGSLQSLFTLSGNWSSQSTGGAPSSAAAWSRGKPSSQGQEEVGLSQEGLDGLTASPLGGDRPVTQQAAPRARMLQN